MRKTQKVTSMLLRPTFKSAHIPKNIHQFCISQTWDTLSVRSIPWLRAAFNRKHDIPSYKSTLLNSSHLLAHNPIGQVVVFVLMIACRHASYMIGGTITQECFLIGPMFVRTAGWMIRRVSDIKVHQSHKFNTDFLHGGDCVSGARQI